MGKPLHVLMIEDSEDDALLNIRALKKGGYDPEYTRVETAGDMRTALLNDTWDVILCGYKLPDFNGFKAIALLKKLGRDIPLIIVSGAIGEEMAAECMRLGALDYIRKDNLSRLVPAIKREIAEVKSRIERRRAEEAVLASEFRLKALFENMSSCAAVLEAQDDGADFVFKDFNRSAEIKGKIDRNNLIGKSLLLVFPGVRDTGLLEVLRRVWKTGRAEQLPAFYYSDARIQGWWEYYIYRLPDGKVVALYNDVTERKEAEKKILESEEKYRLLVENGREVIIIAQKGVLKFVNQASVEMFDSYERLTSTPFIEFVHPDDRELVMSYHLRRLKGEQVPSHYTFRVITKTGIERWVEIRTTVVSWEGQPATLNFLTDVDRRMRAEEKLKESEERFNSLFEHSQDCVYILDLAGNFIDANTSALNLLGYDRRDIPSLNIVSLLHETDMAKGLQQFDEIVRTGFLKVIGEFTLKGKNGRLVHVENQASIVYRDGKPYSVLGIARDNTERIRAQEALRESERQHRELVDFLPISLFEMDVQGNITSANPAIFDLFEYAQSDLETGLKSFQMIVPDDLERFGNNLQKLLSGEKKGPSEYRGVRKDGSTFPFLVCPSVIIREGRPMGIRGAIIDLTERKQAEEKLQKSEEKYRNILSGIEEGYFVVDLAGKLIFFNDSLCRMYGYSREELSGLHYSQYTDKENAEKLFSVFNTMYRTGSSSARYNFELIRKGGIRRSLSASATLIKDSEGKPTGFRGIVLDVTEHREMEEAIRLSEEKHRTIIEQMADGYFEVDLSGHFTFVNDAECRNLGYSREEMLGMHSRQYLVKERRGEVYELFEKIYNTGIPVKSYDLELLKKDGTRSYQAISPSLIRNAEGKPVGFRGISRDITERRIAEIQLRNYAEEISDLYNNAPCGYHSLGPDGSFLRINDTELKWL
jgi:PAS domain S-box-containing protein